MAQHCFLCAAVLALSMSLSACAVSAPVDDILSTDSDLAAGPYEYEEPMFFLGSAEPLFDGKNGSDIPIDAGDYWACWISYVEVNDEWSDDSCAVINITFDETGEYSFTIAKAPYYDPEDTVIDPLYFRFMRTSPSAWTVQVTGSWKIYDAIDEESILLTSDALSLPADTKAVYGFFEYLADGFVLIPTFCNAVDDEILVDLIRRGHLTQGRCVAKNLQSVSEIVKLSRATTGLFEFLYIAPKHIYQADMR